MTVSHVCGGDSLFVRQLNFSSHNDKLGTVEVNLWISPGETLEIPMEGVMKLPELAKEVGVQAVVRGHKAADASLVFGFKR